jgi:hypothetical protein
MRIAARRSNRAAVKPTPDFIPDFRMACGFLLAFPAAVLDGTLPHPERLMIPRHERIELDTPP